MPKPNLPPTPGSSSDLRGKEATQPAPTFHLPPTALEETDRASSASATPSANGSDSSYRPISPATPAQLSRKRTASQSGSGAVVTTADFTLPPPPTRSRKIIQMKPRDKEQHEDVAGQSTHGSTPQTATKTQTATTAAGAAPAGGKKGRGNSSNTTAAGRKIARKTAHSLIERRRRSKMNEEFAVLKDMIPACQGQEMHKLAILQASIDYLRYLERCVSDLQAQKHSPRPATHHQSTRQPPKEEIDPNDDDEEEEDEEDEDEEMEDEAQNESAISTPATGPQDRPGSMVSLPSLSQITTSVTTSPSIFSAGGRHYSMSSASQASFSPYLRSAHTSPAFGPQLSHLATPGSTSILPPPYNTASSLSSRETFGLGSPAIKPLDATSKISPRPMNSTNGRDTPFEPVDKRRRGGAHAKAGHDDPDHEATAALLMLNHDRRSWSSYQDGPEGVRGGTGLSVRDLLSG